MAIPFFDRLARSESGLSKASVSDLREAIFLSDLKEVMEDLAEKRFVNTLRTKEEKEKFAYLTKCR